LSTLIHSSNSKVVLLYLRTEQLAAVVKVGRFLCQFLEHRPDRQHLFR